MSKNNENLNQHFEDLIVEGNEIIQLVSKLGFIDHLWDTLNGEDVAKVNSWAIRCGQLIKNICSDDSLYFKRLNSVITKDSFVHIDTFSANDIGIVLGSIQAVYSDYKNGMLDDIKNLLRAEIFSDFLEMGEHLLNEGYKDAAAIIIGTVLEDTLRKLAIENDIPLKKNNGSSKSIGRLNEDLTKKGAYNELRKKEILSWADLRNKAAHGYYDEYNKEQVKIMLISVQNFCSNHIS